MNRKMANGRCRMHGGKSTGAPPEKMIGNKNAVSTGEHEAIWMDTLDDSERVLFPAIKTDPLEQINHMIKLMEIRERRMMMRIQAIQKGAESKSIDRKFQRVESTTKAGKTSSKMLEVERNEKERAKLERILSIEDALTRVQDKKTKLLELKHKFLVDEVPPDEDADDGFINALKGKAAEVWDNDEEEIDE